jgi:hypothetical protein
MSTREIYGNEKRMNKGKITIDRGVIDVLHQILITDLHDMEQYCGSSVDCVTGIIR